MNNTKTLAIVAVLTAVVVGIFGAQLVQPASAQQCASSASSASGSAASSSEATQDKESSCSTIAEATPSED